MVIMQLPVVRLDGFLLCCFIPLASGTGERHSPCFTSTLSRYSELCTLLEVLFSSALSCRARTTLSSSLSRTSFVEEHSLRTSSVSTLVGGKAVNSHHFKDYSI